MVRPIVGMPVGSGRRLTWLPYALWVSFAAVLNFAIWRLNAGT